MIFFYQEESGSDTLEISGDNYTHIVKSRRSKVGDLIGFRNLQDNYLYQYELEEIGRKKAILTLKEKNEEIKEASKKLHIG
ncbi:MAG: RsmE family RNA methyltransferase, partial [Campylobacterales bacterium]|nr:RsmE family RNA methyltransferase [Campylobacterales bacterium]